jgi:hypothetical protein
MSNPRWFKHTFMQDLGLALELHIVVSLVPKHGLAGWFIGHARPGY